MTRGWAYNDDVRTTTYLHTQKDSNNSYNRYYVGEDNSQIIAANQINTRFFARNDLHWTDIIEVPKDDIINIRKFVESKGFTDRDYDINLTGTEYRNGTNVPDYWGINKPCPYGGGKENGNKSSLVEDPHYYFYKGFDSADCIEYLFELGILTIQQQQ